MYCYYHLVLGIVLISIYICTIPFVLLWNHQKLTESPYNTFSWMNIFGSYTTLKFVFRFLLSHILVIKASEVSIDTMFLHLSVFALRLNHLIFILVCSRRLAKVIIGQAIVSLSLTSPPANSPACSGRFRPPLSIHFISPTTPCRWGSPTCRGWCTRAVPAKEWLLLSFVGSGPSLDSKL